MNALQKFNKYLDELYIDDLFFTIIQMIDQVEFWGIQDAVARGDITAYARLWEFMTKKHYPYAHSTRYTPQPETHVELNKKW